MRQLIRRILPISWIFLMLSAVCGCTSVPETLPEPVDPIRWTILNDGDGRADLSGRANTTVFSQLSVRPDIQFCTEDWNVAVSRMLVENSLPELITVPTGGALEQKLLNSGKVWDIKELSEALYDRVPVSVRDRYEKQNGRLYGLVGGCSGAVAVAEEGVYVREEYAFLLGEPSMNTADTFVAALHDFVKMAEDNRLFGAGGMLPVVFGENNSGMLTVEHLCGVLPAYRQGALSYHRIFSPQMQDVLTFFERLKPFSRYRIFESYSAERLTELMKEAVFVYIGSSDFVENFNLNHPKERFAEIVPPMTARGFLAAENASGEYITFVSQNCDRATAESILLPLYSDESDRTLMYGVEDEDWVMVNGEITMLESTRLQMEADPTAFLQKSGIAAFPYLSLCGVSNPYLPRLPVRLKDVSDWQYYISPTDYQGYYVQQLDNLLPEFYEEVAGSTVGVGDILARIQLLQTEREPLIVS